MPLLEIEGLTVEFPARQGVLKAVEHVHIQLEPGEVLGIVGESGSGKSVSMLALMGLVPFPGRVQARTMRFNGHDLLRLDARERRRMVGRDMAMIFQDPIASLNPCFTVEYQLTEPLRLHLGLTNRQARTRAIELLEQVGIADPQGRLAAYPHQLSGGMSQRVMIAMAIACGPKLLIADEPTTALDVTIQAQILDLLQRLQKELSMAVVLISHNLGVVSDLAQRVAVMYAGQVVEMQSAAALFAKPRHPYTDALLRALPQHNQGRSRLQTIPGLVPGMLDRPSGCLFAPRCSHVQPLVCTSAPALQQVAEHGGDCVRCHFPLKGAQ
jgi:dipeptide transport system ATP-binding protein